jgi:urea transport system substrate-binding protein
VVGLRQGQEARWPQDKPLTNDPMEATYIGINMWDRRLKNQVPDTDKVIAMPARPSTHRRASSARWTKKPPPAQSVFIGEIKADGQFNVVWKTPGPVKANPGARTSKATTKPDEPVK